MGGTVATCLVSNGSLIGLSSNHSKCTTVKLMLSEHLSASIVIKCSNKGIYFG